MVFVRWSGWKSRKKNQNFVHIFFSILFDILVRRPLPVTQVFPHAFGIYFFLSVGTISKIAYILLSNIIRRKEKTSYILTKHCEIKQFNKSKPFFSRYHTPSQHNFLFFLQKKGIYIGNSGFWEGIFTQIPGARRGFWKSPRARAAARRDFQNPRRADEDLGKIHDHKPEFSTYFFLNPCYIKLFSIYLLLCIFIWTSILY